MAAPLDVPTSELRVVQVPSHSRCQFVVSLEPYDRCVVGPHCVNFHFPADQWYFPWASSHVVIGHVCLIFDEASFKSFAHVSSFLLLRFEFCIFWLPVLYQMGVFQTFSPCMWLILPCSSQCHLKSRSFQFWWNIINQLYSFMNHAFGVLTNIWLTHCRKQFFPCFLLEVL